MGQAKRRKAEIDNLKASGSKKIDPFIIRGAIVNGKVVYDTSRLTPAQARFVDGCVNAINNDQIPNMSHVPTQEDSLTFVMYKSPSDYVGMLAAECQGDPDEEYREFEMMFNKTQSRYPQVGFSYTRDELVELGTEQAGMMMDLLKEGGVWPWPNAHVVFEKQGDRMVVIDTI